MKPEDMEAYVNSRLTFFFEPYPWQERLNEVIREKNTIAAISSNKIGKCLTYSTLIDTPSGKVSVGSLFEKGKPFDIYAWDGEKKVIAKAHAPFKKHGLHKCYRLTMSDGQWVSAADHHSLLCDDGVYRHVSDLLSDGVFSFRETFSEFPNNLKDPSCSEDVLISVSGLQHSISGTALSAHAGDGQHSTQIQPDCQDDYLADSCLSGEPPLLGRDTVQVSPPLPDGFLKYIPSWLNVGVREGKYKDILRQGFFLPYTLLRYVGQLVGSLSQSVCGNCLELIRGYQEAPQLASVSFFEPQLSFEVEIPYHNILPSSFSPLYVCGNEIESIRLISGSQEVYDFTVDKYHNYFAGGLIHHNTADIINIIISWLVGYEPWSPVEKDASDGIEIGGEWYRKSSLGIEPPVDLILTGEDWKTHIGKTLVPEIKKWMPVGWAKTKKNEQGVEYYWEVGCGKKKPSTLTLMSYSQDDSLFESFRVQGVVMDEPPPKSKYKAMSRGLLLDNGKTLLSLTPIKEAWILDDIVLSGRKDIAIVDGLCITDNPDLYNGDRKMLDPLTEIEKAEYFDLLLYEDKEKKKYVSDRGHAAEVYLENHLPFEKHADISKLKILKFIKDIDPDDVPPRVFGEFKSLVGRVLKEFDTNIHMIKPFDVPTDWPVTVMIDFHLSTPQAISYWAVDKLNCHYSVGETWKNISSNGIADDIIRHLRSGLRIEDAYIDPLSKGDTAYMRNQLGADIEDAYTTIENKLAEHGITLHVASKDKVSGIRNIREWLKGPNGKATCYIFDDCERHLFEVQRWVYDDNGLPQKENDHFCENWYRYSLTGAKYEDYQVNSLPHHETGSAGAWMGL